MKNQNSKVVLLGYMTSGKSTIGKALANRFGMEFFDLDEEISNQVGMEIPSIFSEKGELFFRKKESEVLSNLLQSENQFVLSLGGGTPCYGNNITLVNQSTPNSFYLKLSIPNLVKRISKEKHLRPLVAAIPDHELPEFIGKHLFERTPFYTKANNTIFCDGKTIDEIILEIENALV